jgi:hypothetical protein
VTSNFHATRKRNYAVSSASPLDSPSSGLTPYQPPIHGHKERTRNDNYRGNLQQGGQLPDTVVTAAASTSQAKAYGVAAYGGEDLDRAPRVAKFQVTEDFAREIVRLAALVTANELHQVEWFDGHADFLQYDPETDPDDAQEAGEENSVRTECDMLAVTQDEFFFRAYVKHTDKRVQCAAQPIAELAAHFSISLDEPKLQPSEG